MAMARNASLSEPTYFDFSIVICTYNGAQRLPALFEHLLACWQFVPPDRPRLRWEILVVDNNSSDDTAALVQQVQVQWPQDCPLRYCFEVQQGASYARELGVREARAALIGFLDDDNLPAPDWVDAAHRFAQDYPQAGAFGSQIHGDFEVEPPPELKALLPFLAIVERGQDPLRYDSPKRVLPPSAGLVVRRQAWLGSMPETCLLRGRKPGSMVTGEDTEALTYLLRSGWEIWYNPAMQLWHRIPHWRLERSYLIPFFQGIGLSRYVTRMQALSPWLRPLALLAYALNDLRKALGILLCYGFGLRHSLVAQCELTLSLASLRSPLHFWRLGASPF
ncbi:MAG: glycosyltransferase family 2 protein [Synechococcales cyanobacterium RM1_1_8]|nr:glycosyltransferase family 2 protein [Synechococcales cyanobacterium RM1_1_8]